MSNFCTPSNAIVAADGMVSADAVKPAPPPGTRDACPTREISIASGNLWGSRLGCRGGGWTGSPTPCRPADNPFASHRIEGLPYRYNELGLTAIRQRLEEMGGRSAIVGPKGSGKTTLLEELASAVPGEPVLLRIEGSCRHPWRATRAQLPRPVTSNHVVLVDGAEQLGRLGWHLLLRATRPARILVATLHRPGRLPTLIECRTEPTLLRSLVEELVPSEAAALAPSLERLFQRHGGDIRLCFRELYDVYAGRESTSFLA